MSELERKRPRSPNCPGIPLQDALQKAKKVYEQEHTHPADRSVIAKDLGYSGISGASAATIGALRQYGILEDSNGGLRISDDAVTIFELPGGSPERNDALKRLAFNPALFGELYSQYPERPPSEANLRHILIRKGFLSKQADEVSLAYRENCELVGSDSTGYNNGDIMKPSYATSLEQPQAIPVNDVQQSRADRIAPAVGNKPLITQTLVVSIPRNFKVDVTVHGDEMKKEDLVKIKSQFARWIEGLEEAFE